MRTRTIKPKWVSGDPWKYCDSCGVKYRASQTKKNWQGLVQCERCYDPKHPLLEPVHVQEDVSVEDARPLGDITYHDTVTYDDL